MTKLSDFRKEYTAGNLAENEVNKNPILQFNQWMEQAIAEKTNAALAADNRRAADCHASAAVSACGHFAGDHVFLFQQRAGPFGDNN